MGNHPCGADCLPDNDTSLRISHPDTENILMDLNRPSDEKKYKIVFQGDPFPPQTHQDATPRRTLNFDEVALDDRAVSRPFDLSFSQSAIAPFNDSINHGKNPQPLTAFSGQNYINQRANFTKNVKHGTPQFYQAPGVGKENYPAAIHYYQ